MHRRKSLSALVVAAVLALASATLAAADDCRLGEDQGRPPEQGGSRRPNSSQERRPVVWWHEYKKELGLTRDQVNRIEGIFQAWVAEAKELRRELDAVEAQMQALISSPNATEAAVSQQADAVEAARSRLGKARTMLLFKTRQVLTPEQRVKLEELHKHALGRAEERRREP